MFIYLLLLFTVVPALELYLLFTIGGRIGLLETIWIILLTGVVGASLARSQGRSLLLSIQADLGKGTLPADKLVQGLLVFAGGILLLTPGFLTDLFGLAMVIPFTRIPFSIYLRYMFAKMIARGTIQFSGGSTGSSPFRGQQGNYEGSFQGAYVFTEENSDEYDRPQVRDVTPAKVIDITSAKKNR